MTAIADAPFGAPDGRPARRPPRHLRPVERPGHRRSPAVPALVGVGTLAVAVGVTDLARRRIPNAVLGAALPAMLVLVAPLGARAVLAGVGGAVLALLVHATVHLLAPHALGAGDVKLAGVLGIPLAAGSWWALAAAPALARGDHPPGRLALADRPHHVLTARREPTSSRWHAWR